MPVVALSITQVISKFSFFGIEKEQVLQRPQEDLELVFNSDIELDDNIIPETPTKKLLLPNQHHQHHLPLTRNPRVHC